MCGIAGLFGVDGVGVDPARLGLMLNALAHRGPDDEGVHIDGNLGLAHRRLAILDLTAAGRQPMSNEDGTVWLVYNGQLYDFEGARAWLQGRGHQFRSRTDTEILIHMYEERGDAFVEQLDGMFAFALWDSRRQRLVLGRDRLGIKPLYYIRHDQTLYFASELKALLALPDLPRELDPLGLTSYLYQSSLPGDSCILSGYQKLPPAHLLVAEGARHELRRYWELPGPTTTPSTSTGADTGARASSDAGEVLLTRLRTAVRSHLVADVPVGAFLSGGLDSSVVTMEAASATEGELHTFSVRFTGFKDLDEGPIAAQVAATLGTTHHELALGPECLDSIPELIRHADEPFAIPSALALYHLARYARQYVPVVLTGDGADEILGGYPWRHNPGWGPGAGAWSFASTLAMSFLRSRRTARAGGPSLTSQMYARMNRMLRRPGEHYAEIVAAFTPEELQALLVPDLTAAAADAWTTSALVARYEEQHDDDEINRRLRADLHTTLVDEMLTKVDRMTMAWGIEARVPFLDRHVVEWAMQVPGHLKLRRGTGKLLLRRALARRLPQIAGLPKRGFSLPFGAWLRGPLREQLGDTLSAASLGRRGLFRADAVSGLLDAHLSGKADYSRKLFSLMALEMWLGEIEPRISLAR